MVSSLDAFSYATFVITDAIFAYSAFWALNIRKALFVQLYRNQALGIVLVALSFAAIELAQVLDFTERVLNPVFFFPILYLAFATTFYWVDTSISSARRSDPLLRNTVRWRSLRKILWPLIVIPVVFISAAGVTSGREPTPTNQVSPLIIILFFFTFLPLFLPAISGVFFLPIAARRSGDKALRRQLRWFGLFAVFALGVVSLAPNFGSATSTSYAQTLVLLIGFSGGGYALYRSAKSLVPLNKLPQEAQSE